MSMEPGRSLAGIGALMLIIGSFLPFLGIVGFILLMIGLKYLADYTKTAAYSTTPCMALSSA